MPAGRRKIARSLDVPPGPLTVLAMTAIQALLPEDLRINNQSWTIPGSPTGIDDPFFELRIRFTETTTVVHERESGKPIPDRIHFRHASCVAVNIGRARTKIHPPGTVLAGVDVCAACARQHLPNTADAEDLSDLFALAHFAESSLAAIVQYLPEIDAATQDSPQEVRDLVTALHAKQAHLSSFVTIERANLAAAALLAARRVVRSDMQRAVRQRIADGNDPMPSREAVMEDRFRWGLDYDEVRDVVAQETEMCAEIAASWIGYGHHLVAPAHGWAPLGPGRAGPTAYLYGAATVLCPRISRGGKPAAVVVPALWAAALQRGSVFCDYGPVEDTELADVASPYVAELFQVASALDNLGSEGLDAARALLD